MDLSQVTLTQMRYAAAVQQQRNFQRAADSCFVSQSGLSMQILKLEKLLGVRLFDRTKKPVLLTTEGERALAQMRQVLRETERLGQLFSEGDEPAGRFRLGVIPSMAPTVLPLILPAFVKRFGRVELLIEELKTAEIISRLGEDTLDAGIAATPLGIVGLSEVSLALEPMVAYLPKGDALLKRKQLTEKDLRERSLWIMPEGHCFRSQVLSFCRASQGIEDQQVTFESGSFETLTRLVDGGLGATILPALVARHLAPARRKAQVRALVKPVPLREIGLVTARNDLQANIKAALVELCQQALGRAIDVGRAKGVILDPMATSEMQSG